MQSLNDLIYDIEQATKDKWHPHDGICVKRHGPLVVAYDMNRRHMTTVENLRTAWMAFLMADNPEQQEAFWSTIRNVDLRYYLDLDRFKCDLDAENEDSAYEKARLLLRIIDAIAGIKVGSVIIVSDQHGNIHEH